MERTLHRSDNVATAPHNYNVQNSSPLQHIIIVFRTACHIVVLITARHSVVFRTAPHCTTSLQRSEQLATLQCSEQPATAPLHIVQNTSTHCRVQNISPLHHIIIVFRTVRHCTTLLECSEQLATLSCSEQLTTEPLVFKHHKTLCKLQSMCIPYQNLPVVYAEALQLITDRWQAMALRIVMPAR